MKIYRLSFRRKDDEHAGYSYHASKRDAKIEQRQNTCEIPDCEGFNVELEGPYRLKPTKRGILAALNCFGGHPDNG